MITIMLPPSECVWKSSPEILSEYLQLFPRHFIENFRLTIAVTFGLATFLLTKTENLSSIKSITHRVRHKHHELVVKILPTK